MLVFQCMLKKTNAKMTVSRKTRKPLSIPEKMNWTRTKPHHLKTLHLRHQRKVLQTEQKEKSRLHTSRRDEL